MTEPITNALTIDVEDYFQVSALAPYVQRSEWTSRECRIEANVDKILQLLDGPGIKATFFTLGWIAERYPETVRRIVDNGHELASHGYAHLRASDQSENAFYADIHLAKILLEDIAGQTVMGYRAPSFSIKEQNFWAFECLERAGYLYSSSIYPVRHDHYGMPNAPRFAHIIGSMVEIPATTVHSFRRNWPAGGGGYFRLLPYWISRRLIRHVNEKDGEAAVFYFHPWELDPGQPRIPGIDAKTRFRHYMNIHRVEGRLRRLLKDFHWGRMDSVFQAELHR